MNMNETNLNAPVMDWEQLRSVSDGDTQFESELLTDFTEFCALTLEQLRNESDISVRAKIAHTLKGSARTIGAQKIGAIAEFYEQEFKSAQEHNDVCSVFESAFEEFSYAIKNTDVREAA